MPALLDRITSAFATRYPIEHELGRGGTATVYLARDPKRGLHRGCQAIEGQCSDHLPAPLARQSCYRVEVSRYRFHSPTSGRRRG
jgi:hypothetical protein